MESIEEANADLVRELTDDLNAGDFDAIEASLESGYGEDDDRPTAGEIRRAEEARREAFPDYHEEIETLATDGVDVVVIYDVTGTHEGAASWDDLYRYRSVPSTVPPTGEEIRFPLIRRFRIEDGRITLWESMQTPLTMLVGLGMDWEAFTSELPAMFPE